MFKLRLEVSGFGIVAELGLRGRRLRRRRGFCKAFLRRRGGGFVGGI